MEELSDELNNLEFPLPNTTSTPVSATSRAYRRSGHPRGRRRRSRGPSRNGSFVQPEEDSGYEASPSSNTSSRSFSFEDFNFVMPNYNTPPASLNELDAASDEEIEMPRNISDESLPSGLHSVSRSIPISRSQPSFIRPFSPYLSPTMNFMASGYQAAYLTRERGGSAPPAYCVERRTIGTQTESTQRSPTVSFAARTEPSVRQRRASAGMAGPLPDVLPPSVHRTRPRSISTTSFPLFDPHGHPLTPQEEENPFQTAGNRLRSLSDAFEDSRRADILLRDRQRRTMEVEVAELLVSFFRYFLQPFNQVDHFRRREIAGARGTRPGHQRQPIELCHIL